MEDVEIIRLLFARDENAILQMQEKYGKLCFRVAFRLLNSKEDAEECVNDAYMGVWDQVPPVIPEHLPAFLCAYAPALRLPRLFVPAQEPMLLLRLS